MSATLKAFANSPEHYGSRVWQEPPAASIFSLAAALKACAWTVSFFEISPRARILTGSERFARPFSLSVAGRHLGAGVEALLEVGEVDRLRLGPEVLERHRLLHVRAAQLSHPHVDRVLPALIAGLALGAGRASRRPCARGPRSCPAPSPRHGRSACAAVATRASASGCAARSPRTRGSLAAISAHLDQVRDDAKLSLQLRRVLPLDGFADPPQPQRLQGRFLAGIGPVGGPNLLDLHRAHEAPLRLRLLSRGVASAAGASASGATPPPRVAR